MKKKQKKWLLVFLWAGFIFFLSHQPGLSSNLPGQYDFILRKIAHFTEYGLLSIFLFLALGEHSLSKRKALFLSAGIALGYAFLDEFHQSFIRDRQASFIDVAIDGLGIIMAAVLARPFWKRNSRYLAKKSENDRIKKD